MITFAAYFKRRDILLVLAFLLTFRLGEAQALKLIAPFLLDPTNQGGLGLTTSQLGIVYGSDVIAEPKVHVVADFPEASHAPILYPAAIIAASTNPDAQGFLDFIRSKDGQLIFKANGFTLLE